MNVADPLGRGVLEIADEAFVGLGEVGHRISSRLLGLVVWRQDLPGLLSEAVPREQEDEEPQGGTADVGHGHPWSRGTRRRGGAADAGPGAASADRSGKYGAQARPRQRAAGTSRGDGASFCV